MRSSGSLETSIKTGLPHSFPLVLPFGVCQFREGRLRVWCGLRVLLDCLVDDVLRDSRRQCDGNEGASKPFRTGVCECRDNRRAFPADSKEFCFPTGGTGGSLSRGQTPAPKRSPNAVNVWIFPATVALCVVVATHYAHIGAGVPPPSRLVNERRHPSAVSNGL